MSSLRRRWLAVTAAVLLLGTLPVRAAGAGAAPDAAPDLATALAEAVRTWQEAHGAHAVSAAVRVPERGVSWGTAVGDVRDGWPATADTQYRVGSATKTFTSVLVLQLVDESRLSLDDVLARWYPSYPNASRITVRNLLQHTSGIKEMQLEDAWFMALSVLQVSRMWRPDDLIAWSASPFLMWSTRSGRWVDRRPDPPGTVWRYAQPNYILLGRIIEKVTGGSYADNVRTRIVEPLGLEHTLVPRSGDDPFLPGWSNLFGMIPELLPTTVLPSYNAPFSAAWSAGGVVTTPDDLSTFHESIRRPGLLSAASVAAMHTAVPTDPDDPGSDRYGLGISAGSLGVHETWGHDGGIPGFTTVNRFEPACGVYVAVATNTDDDPWPAPGDSPAPGDRHLTDLGARLLDITDADIGCAVP